MMPFVRRFAAAVSMFALGLSLCGSALAEQPVPASTPGTAIAAPVLTLDDAVRAALARNPQILAAREAVTAAQENVVVARTGFLPTVSATGTGAAGTASTSVTSSGQPPPPLFPPTTTGSVSLAATLPLFDGGRTRAAVLQAASQVASAEGAFRQAQQDVALQAATAFLSVLKAERLAAVREQQLTQAQAQLAQSQAQVRAGVAAQADVIQVLAQVAQAQVDLLAARAQIATTKAALQSAIAEDAAAPVEVQEPPAPAAAVGISADAVLQAAEANRPEIAKARAAIQSGQAALDQAYVSAGPQVSVGANAGYTPFSTSAVLNNSTSYGLTATVALPLYDAGKGHAEISAAQAGLRSAQAQFESARLAVRQDAYQAYLAAVQAAANLAATQAARAAAQEALRVADGRYRAGVGTIVEVITARTQAVQAEVNATSALYDYETALATLRHAEGISILATAQRGSQ